MNLRARVESDLSFTLEGLWGLPVELINPITGAIQTQSANDNTKLLKGQVIYDTTVQNPETGLDVVTPKPVVTLRITSLDDIPVRGWSIRFPISPVDGAPMVTHYVDRVDEDGGSFGFVRIYPGKLVQE